MGLIMDGSFWEVKTCNASSNFQFIWGHIIVKFTCSPMQKAMMNLCTAIAKHKYQTMEALVPRPIAMPSKTACKEMANMIKKPLMATWNEAFLIFAKTSADCGFFGAHARKLAHFNFRPHTHSTENSSCCPVNYDQEIGILLYILNINTLKPSYFKKQGFSSSFLLTWSK